MSDVVIRVKDLSKEYRLGKIGHGTLYRDLQTGWAHLLKREDPNSKIVTSVAGQGVTSSDRFFALKDISFDVFKGETVGIIGRNGAGKSTLLKIISRVTAPTGGIIKLRGRVASLLEVGTGFHPELSGRENVFLNGAILGMRKAEIEQKFDEIVRFAEIEKFIDTPVKRYSSGMYVRLAFAVAAHLEPEILIVDEVLAVGDARFQKKCLGKMGEVAHEGRTVLFVSHNMAAVKQLCPRTLLLSEGTIEMDDVSEKVIDSYIYDQNLQSAISEIPSWRAYEILSAPGDEYVKLLRVSLVSEKEKPRSSFNMDESFFIDISYLVLKEVSNFKLYIRVYTYDGILAFCSSEWDGENEIPETRQKPGHYRTRIRVPRYFLNSGMYSLSVLGLIYNNRIVFEDLNVLYWKINCSGGLGGVVSVERKGVFRPLLQWTRIPENNDSP